jgi:protoheme IX farnesyltransferase
MWWDADIDARMARTAQRPIPAGRIESGEALAFGVVLAVASVAMLGLFAGWLAAGLLAFTIFFYAVLYTMGLKRWTAQNIVIGGAAGAFPPMIGWAAATGTIGLESVLLFLIIFFWTPPHFWALALLRKKEYARAGIPMLPVVAGEDETRRQILIYSVVVAVVGVAPALFGFAGLIYGTLASMLGVLFLALAIEVWRKRRGVAAQSAARRLFAFSVLYLFLLFAVLLVEGMR